MARQNMYNARNSEHYDRWRHMNDRCNNPKVKDYKHYGERGIKVCREWHRDNQDGLQNYSDYIETHLGQKPGDSHSIDRIDNDGNYEPGNIKWASKSKQSRNTRVLRAGNTSGYRGVSLHKASGRHQSQIQITVGGKCKRKYLGLYDTPLEAALAYDCYILDNDLDHTTNGTYDWL